MSQIITFYSYKGGVGRSMALANVAVLLSKWGKKVLMIDWDLEAPGLEYFFKPYLPNVDWKEQKGVLEWLYAVQNQEDVNWQDWVIPFKTKISTTDIHLLVAGKANGRYSDMLREFSVSKFYDEHRGGHLIEQFRNELLASYDYVLIDSRTGVTDFGGICTIQMPDILVMLFSATEQGLSGTLKIAGRAEEAHQNLPFDRFKLLICPVPSRISSTTEYETSRTWLARSGETFKEYYEDWIPTSVDIREFMQLLKIPNIDYFSFGESLPVIDQGVIDPAGLGYAYENLAMLLGRGLDEVDVFVDKREKYLEEVSGERQEGKVLENSLKPQLGIYISYVEEDEEFKNELIELMRLRAENMPLKILELKNLALGRSKRNAVIQMLDDADIVIIIVSKNYAVDYFPDYALIQSPLFGKARPFNEYSEIENYSHSMIIPIYLDSGIANIPPFIVDRLGIPDDNRKAINDLGEVIDDLMLMLNHVYQENYSQ